MTLKSDAKFEEKLTCCLENDEEFGKFSPEYVKVSKLELQWDPIVQSRKCMSLKFTEKLCVMTMRNETKIEEELTCRLKACVRYFSLFLKEYVSWLFRTKYFEIKFNLQLLYLPIVSRAFILLSYHARLMKNSIPQSQVTLLK